MPAMPGMWRPAARAAWSVMAPAWRDSRLVERPSQRMRCVWTRAAPACHPSWIAPAALTRGAALRGPAEAHGRTCRRHAAGSSASRAAADDPYEVLGVPRSAPLDEVKAAYRRLALRWHPDRNPADSAKAEAEFKRVSKAYSVLSDPAKREHFDRFGSDTADGAAPAWGGQGRPLTEEEAAMIFKQMFGDKPLHDIIREMEEVVEQQSGQMSAREEELRGQVGRLRAEAQAFAAQAALHRRGSREEKQLHQLAAARAKQADQIEQSLALVQLQHLEQRSQARFAMSRLRMLDPRVRAQNTVRVCVAWGAALGSYFVLHNTLLYSLCTGLAASFVVRLAFGLLRRFRPPR
mmetsp:Transcript_84281/g.239058  ORF Transcript_84281/g.239058 Transcript_84281/m.239058 type:complete len:349 (+) Transcript_84281:131-1177(+)